MYYTDLKQLTISTELHSKIMSVVVSKSCNHQWIKLVWTDLNLKTLNSPLKRRKNSNFIT